MEPWGEPELLVWHPEAVASAPPLPVGLEVKLGTLVLLLVLTLICSLVPICVLRRPGASPEAPAFRQKVLSLVSCFAGGVFLATCLLDLLPDYLSAIDEALAALHVRPGSITPTSGQRTHPWSKKTSSPNGASIEINATCSSSSYSVLHLPDAGNMTRDHSCRQEPPQ